MCLAFPFKEIDQKTHHIQEIQPPPPYTHIISTVKKCMVGGLEISHVYVHFGKFL